MLFKRVGVKEIFHFYENKRAKEGVPEKNSTKSLL